MLSYQIKSNQILSLISYRIIIHDIRIESYNHIKSYHIKSYLSSIIIIIIISFIMNHYLINYHYQLSSFHVIKSFLLPSFHFLSFTDSSVVPQNVQTLLWALQPLLQVLPLPAAARVIVSVLSHESWVIVLVKWAFTETSIHSPMALCRMRMLTRLLTQRLRHCSFCLRAAYVDSPYAIGLRKLTRLRVLLTQTSYDSWLMTHNSWLITMTQLLQLTYKGRFWKALKWVLVVSSTVVSCKLVVS